ncbi:MAG: DNA alkylation repair protein [Acidobacteria bacterium]|nr:DNA alkylation repair protein [Acidobacteriota bacterium]
MTYEEVMTALEKMGTEQTRKIWRNHGAKDPMFGVKIGDMKTLVKKIKVDQALANQLFESGNADAMYLAGLIADPHSMSAEQLQKWAETPSWYMVREYAVAAVAAEGPFGLALGLKWIDSELPAIQGIGWSALSGVLAIRENNQLDLDQIRTLLERVRDTLQTSANRVRYTMNNFVISVGTYVPELKDFALECGKAIGKVHVEMGNTACKVPYAPDYIQKVEKMGRTGQKRKAVRC